VIAAAVALIPSNNARERSRLELLHRAMPVEMTGGTKGKEMIVGL
jgi:hypothetical protein